MTQVLGQCAGFGSHKATAAAAYAGSRSRALQRPKTSKMRQILRATHSRSGAEPGWMGAKRILMDGTEHSAVSPTWLIPEVPCPHASAVSASGSPRPEHYRPPGSATSNKGATLSCLKPAVLYGAAQNGFTLIPNDQGRCSIISLGPYSGRDFARTRRTARWRTFRERRPSGRRR
jgi:hypothetical protein